jgi:O-antigen/teichoic acid export membrane protein
MLYQTALKKTGAYIIPVMAGRMVSFLLLPLYTRFLTPSDYGVLELINLIYTLFTTLVGMRFADSLFYYFFKAKDDEQRKFVLSNAFLGAVLLGGAVAVVGWFLAPELSVAAFRSPIYAKFIRLSLATYASVLPIEMGCAYLRALNDSGTYVWVSLVRLVLQIVFNVSFVAVLRIGLVSFLLGDFLAGAIIGGYLLVHCLRPIRLSFQWKMFSQFLKYSMPYAGGGICMMFIHFGDRFFLQRTVSLAAVGIYALAYRLGMLIENLVQPFAVYWNSQVFEVLKQPQGERAYVRFCTYITLVLMFAVVGITVFVRPILRIMVTPAFFDAALYAPVVAFAYVLRAIDAHVRSIFRVEARTGRDARIMAVGAVGTLILYVTLIPTLKLWGAALATVGGFGLMLAYSFQQGQKLRRFPFEYGRMLHVVVCAAAVIALLFFIHPEVFWIQIAIGIPLVLLFPALLLATRFAAPDEVDAVRSAWKRFWLARGGARTAAAELK